MLGISRRVLIAGALVLTWAISLPALAQRKSSPVNSSSAPVPAPILQGKKAFISFEIGDTTSFPEIYSGGPERAYSEFCQGMQQWGRYQLVDDPKDADLIFAIRYVGMGPYLRLQITSPQSGISLWGFAEQIKDSGFKKTRDAGFDTAVTQIVNDVKQLVSQTIPPAFTQP
jgi:hypothetical protein